MCCPEVGAEEGRSQDKWKRKYVIDVKENAGQLKRKSIRHTCRQIRVWQLSSQAGADASNPDGDHAITTCPCGHACATSNLNRTGGEERESESPPRPPRTSRTRWSAGSMTI
jgi:hypothetical protein